MTDIQAAVGRVQLKRLPEIVAERRRLADALPRAARRHRRASGRPSSRTGRAPTGRATACGCPTACDQRAVMQAMLDRGIATRRGVMNIHLEEPYRRRELHALPRSERRKRKRPAAALPQMTDERLGRVAGVLREFLADCSQTTAA